MERRQELFPQPHLSVESRMKKCPFKVGEYVQYRPSFEGRGRIIMTDLNALKPGEKYKIIRVVDAYYLVVEGFELSPGGGLYWTEFKKSN